MEEVLLYFALKYEGDFDKIFKALQTREVVDEDLKKKLISDLNCNYTTIISTDFPEKLKEISCPPFVLFYHGDLDLVNVQTIAIIGTCNPSESGIAVAKSVIREIDEKDITIITGLEKGINKIASENCKNKIVVLGSGIDGYYSTYNKKQFEEIKEFGLIISEYPNNVKPTDKKLINRDRLITGLSEKVIVFEISKESKKMITVGFALEQGKDIFCIPSGYDTENNGTNYLIKEGANIMTSIDDIFSH